MLCKRTSFCRLLAAFLALFPGAALFCGGPAARAAEAESLPVRVLIVPKFEIEHIAGDFPGEGQLFYEHYCAGCAEIKVPHAPPSARFYYNPENAVALLLTGTGKTAAGLSLMSLLAWDAYDFTDTVIVSVGCAGGSTGTSVYGELVLVTAACDLELGHHTGARELTDPARGLTWFPDDTTFSAYNCKLMNAQLAEKVYPLIKDLPLRTTETAKRVLARTFPGEEWAARAPQVMKGTAVTADSYWKGTEDHLNAIAAVRHYECPDPYAVSDMEEIAVMNSAACFGLNDRVVSLRVIVNLDTFLKGESPESLWLGTQGYDDHVTQENSETLDIFSPGMENLFDAGKIVIDAALAGELQAATATATAA